jgi:hypothetical protein
MVEGGNSYHSLNSCMVGAANNNERVKHAQVRHSLAAGPAAR